MRQFCIAVLLIQQSIHIRHVITPSVGETDFLNKHAATHFLWHFIQTDWS